jgi:hypothetical protein
MPPDNAARMDGNAWMDANGLGGHHVAADLWHPTVPDGP